MIATYPSSFTLSTILYLLSPTSNTNSYRYGQVVLLVCGNTLFDAKLWDGTEKTALRIDLWTKKMMVDEMNDFFFQTLMTMADTYTRATRNEALSEEMKAFARDFKKKADEKMMEDEQK